MPREPLKLFISYAHEDEFLREELDRHLVMLRREGEILPWHDRDITAGQEWLGQVHDRLERADLILLLVSSSFLYSDYCLDVETARALERHALGEARVIPVIVRPCDWAPAPFAKLQALPKDGEAITSWKDRDQAWHDVVQGLRAAIADLRVESAERPLVSRHRDKHNERRRAAQEKKVAPDRESRMPRRPLFFTAALLALLGLTLWTGVQLSWRARVSEQQANDELAESQPTPPSRIVAQELPVQDDSNQGPGARLLDAVMRQLQKEPYGVAGDLTTSRAVVFMYHNLSPVFQQALQEVEDARKVADRYQQRMPRTSAEWGSFLDALSRMQTSRESYMQALRNVAAERRPIVERLVDGRIRNTISSIGLTSGKQAAELGALVDISAQVLRQEGRVRLGEDPVIQWPPETDPLLREEIEELIRLAVSSENSGGAWNNLERRLARLRRNLEAAADELRSAVLAHWGHLNDREMAALAELSVLAEVQVDLASNAMFQQTTARRIYLVRQDFGTWKEAN